VPLADLPPVKLFGLAVPYHSEAAAAARFLAGGGTEVIGRRQVFPAASPDEESDQEYLKNKERDADSDPYFCAGR